MPRPGLLKGFLVFVGVIGLGAACSNTPTPPSVRDVAPTDLEPGNLPIRVIKVTDGDTITIDAGNGKTQRVRAACIDAPEVPHTKADKATQDPAKINQFDWGQRSKNRLAEIIRQGNHQIQFKQSAVDSQYGRLVGEIYVNGTLVQEQLAKEGLAPLYTTYLSTCPSARKVASANGEAKAKKTGVWGDPNFVMPWDFRKEQKALNLRD